MDNYWIEVYDVITKINDSFDFIFSEDLIIEKFPNGFPLEYTLCLDENFLENNKVIFAFVKSNAYRINESFIDYIVNKGKLYFGNDVFYVVGNIDIENNFEKKDFYLQEMKQIIYNRKRYSAKSNFHTVVSGTDNAPKVLVIGATNMGNVGDDFSGFAIKECIKSVCPEAEVTLADFNVCKEDIKIFDRVIVGAGGILYYGNNVKNKFINRRQNFANYLKFFYWCKEFNIPVTFVGVGAQGSFKNFVNSSIDKLFFDCAVEGIHSYVVRDYETKNVLFNEKNCIVLPDIVFYYYKVKKKDIYTTPTNNAKSFGIIGNFFKNKIFVNTLHNKKDIFISILKSKYSNNLKYIIMAQEDYDIKDKVIDFFVSMGINIEVIDFRNFSIEEISAVFQSIEGVFTRRFHGLVLAVCNRIPVMVIHPAGDKKQNDSAFKFKTKHERLIYDFLPSMSKNICQSDEQILSFLEHPELFKHNNDEERKRLFYLLDNYESFIKEFLTERRING